MTTSGLIRQEAVERTRNERDDCESFVNSASDEFGGFFFAVGVDPGVCPGLCHQRPGGEFVRRLFRVIEFIVLSTFSEHLAARRWKAAIQKRGLRVPPHRGGVPRTGNRAATSRNVC